MKKILSEYKIDENLFQLNAVIDDAFECPPPFKDQELKSNIIYCSIISQLSQFGIDLNPDVASKIEGLINDQIFKYKS